MNCKKINKKKILGFICLVLGIIFLCFGFFYTSLKTVAPIITSPIENTTQVGTSSINEIYLATSTKQTPSQTSINFLVSGKTISLNFAPGDTLEKVIEDAVLKKIVDIKGENFSGLGFFVDEINGLKEGNGYSWIYYINGKKATVGVSSCKLQNGDLINWVYEKNY